MGKCKNLLLIVWVSVILVMSLHAGAGSGSGTVKIPLRIRGTVSEDMDVSRLKLTVNKKDAPIASAEFFERFIDGERLLGRNFILSIMNFENYDESIANAVSYFVTEVLEEADSLIVHTNVNVHQIKVTPNKERMILEIETRVKMDMGLISRKSSNVVKSIHSEMAALRRSFGTFGNGGQAVLDAAKYFQFFASLIPDIQFYRNEFVIPEKKRFREIHEILGFREGDRYWIYLQNRDVYPFLESIRDLVELVQYQMSTTATSDSSWIKMLNGKVREMTDSLLIGNQYPKKMIRNELIHTNTTFFGVLYFSDKTSSSGKIPDIQLMQILKGISEDTGGLIIETSDPENAIRTLRDHRDRYWEISFNIADDIKKVKMDFSGAGVENQLVFPEEFKEEEISTLLKHLREPAIRIRGMDVRENQLSFTVDSVSFSKKGGFGLLKVIIQFFDGTGKEVFRKSNTLRAGKKKISISTGFPPEFSSGYRIRVSVLDMISNRLVYNEI